MISALVSRVISLTLGTLYPAYASYKAVRTKNVKEYVKWMMYWIVFALFTSVETFSDFFLSFWFPFYYELKICLLIWLLSPATKGSSLLYRKFVHPALVRREQRIDAMIEEAQTRGYQAAVQLGGRGIRYVSTLVMEGVVRAPTIMAELVQTGQLAVEHRRVHEVTDGRERLDERLQQLPQPLEPAVDMDMSDTERAGDAAGPGTESEFGLESETDGEARGEPSKVRPSKSRTTGRRKKTSSTDLTLSSGDEGDDPDFKLPAKKSKKTTAAASTTRKSTRKAK